MSGLRKALLEAMAVIDEGIARSRNPNREGFITNDRLRAILDQHPETTGVEDVNGGHCQDGCRTFEWGEWPGIRDAVLLCTTHGRPAPGWAYDSPDVNGGAS